MLKKYVIFTEHSMKTFKKSYYYLQYNENEESIKKLDNILKKVEYDICGSYSEFSIDINNIANEEILSDKNICNGKFVLPDISSIDGNILNNHFYNGKIKNFFI